MSTPCEGVGITWARRKDPVIVGNEMGVRDGKEDLGPCTDLGVRDLKVGQDSGKQRGEARVRGSGDTQKVCAMHLGRRVRRGPSGRGEHFVAEF